jgi:6-phosphofructokinase 1
MKKRVGILTSGGDCPGLNATIRGVAKALYARMGDNVEIVGIANGYSGLINGDYREMNEDDFRGILTLGGTILGTKRTPFKLMRVVEEDNIDKVAAMKKTYKAAKLDCLLCLGGNGTHKTANLLSQEGLNIIGLPKTIDNDIYGTDVTFGFHTAVDIATDVIDRIHTTAGSHSRVMCIEIMGNKAGGLPCTPALPVVRTSFCCRNSPMISTACARPWSAAPRRGPTSLSLLWPRVPSTARKPA